MRFAADRGLCSSRGAPLDHIDQAASRVLASPQIISRIRPASCSNPWCTSAPISDSCVLNCVDNSFC
jgi:hypothetical protein